MNGGPLPQSRVGTASVDLTLSNHFMRLQAPYGKIGWFFQRKTSKELDLARVNGVDIRQWYRQEECLDSKGIKLNPNEVVLASTSELVRLPTNIAGLIIGRNSYARLGLQIADTANLKSPGHKGHITLHLCNLNPFPIRIYPGLRVCQIIFFFTNSSCDEVEGRYGYEEEVGTSKFYFDEETQVLHTRIRSESKPPGLALLLRLFIIAISGLMAILLGMFTTLEWSISVLAGFVLTLVLFILLELLQDYIPFT